MTIFLQIVGGLALLVFGGEALVRGAVSIAKVFGLPIFIIGLTIVAYGTSSPELAITAQAAIKGYPDIALGNIIGSNISNIFCVLGLSCLIFPIAIRKRIILRDSIIMTAIAVLFVAIGWYGVLTLSLAVVLLGIFLVHNFYIFYSHKKGKSDIIEEAIEEEAEEELSHALPLWQACVACVLGVVCLAYGGDVLVEGASVFARILGVSEAVIGVTVVAFGSSAPELAASVVAAFHKRADIALGNVIGSNIINIVGILGITGLFVDVPFSRSFLQFDLPVMLAATCVLMLVVLTCKTISRWIGGAFFLGYVSYITLLFVS